MQSDVFRDETVTIGERIPRSRRERWSGYECRVGHLRSVALATSVALALLLLAFTPNLPARADLTGAQSTEAAGTLRLLPQSSAMDVGQTVTVEVRLEDCAGYYGLDLRIAFDPALVQVPAGRVTPVWDAFDSTDHFIIKNEANNVSGTVWYAVTNINPAEPFTGTGRICSVVFKGVAAGTVPLQLAYAKGSSRDGIGMYPATVGGGITVRGPARHVVALPLVVRLADMS